MKNNNHISDADLKLVVVERPASTSIENIESHISNCDACQQRLLEFAADSNWRNQFAAELSDLESVSFIDDRTSFHCKEIDSQSSARSGDEFDLQTVDQMLKEVLQPPTHPEMLGRLGRYDIEEVIGCGGMGVVLRGFDRVLHRPIAIKMILPRISKNGTAKQRFAREARAAAVLLHPNVMPIYGIEESNDIPWFVMPLIVGPTLKELVDRNGPLPEREIVRIGRQIASGLAAAHSQGLVHRDIKPENILVDNQVNRVMISDFGLARRATDPSMTQTGFLAGTLNYMSPEQSRGEDTDSRSDLFSLGGLLFFLATGEVPFRSDSAMGVIHKIAAQPHPHVQNLNNEVSSTLANVIDSLLEKSPEDRFQSASQLEQFLGEYLAHLNQPRQYSVPVPPVKTAKESKQNHNQKWEIASWGRAGLFACSLALAAAAYFYGAGYFSSSLPNSLSTGATNTGASSASAKTTSPLNWKAVKAKYNLTEASKFLDEFQELQTNFELLERHFSNDDYFASSARQSDSQFGSQLEALKQDLRVDANVKEEDSFSRKLDTLSVEMISLRDLIDPPPAAVEPNSRN